MGRIVRRVIVHGEVQGVFYRGWTVETAGALALDGWVRNRRDGTVEMVLAGHEDAVARMIERCHEGPPSALVERVEVEDTDIEIAAGFTQRPTV